MIEAAKAYAKLFSSRIVYRDKIIAEYSELENTSWLNRKEKVCYETKHSSYYIFLDNRLVMAPMGTNFGEQNQFVGTITFTGLRPQEDHGVIIQVLEKVFQEKN